MRQVPGQEHTFVEYRTKETDTGILPTSYGESNEFAKWHKHPTFKNGGNWRSRKFHAKQAQRHGRGLGHSGEIGAMRTRFIALRTQSKKMGYAAPLATPEEALAEWFEQSEMCAACGGPLKLHGQREPEFIRGASYGHDHKTGESHGFLHEWCNIAEGQILQMSKTEFENYVAWIKTIHADKAE
jgi:hypothetical protein